MNQPLFSNILFVVDGNRAISIGLAVVSLIGFGLVIFWLGYPKPLKGIPYNKDAAKLWLGDVPSFQKHFGETGEGWDWMTLQCEKLNSRKSRSANRSEAGLTHVIAIVQVFLGPWQKPAVILVDHVEIRDIITRRNKDFDRGGFLTRWLSSTVPHGTISMPTHQRFKAQRQIWAGTMTTDFVVRTFGPHMSRHAGNLVERWRTKAKYAQGMPFEANGDVRGNIFEIVWAAAFGNDLGLTSKQTPETLRTGVQILEDEARFPESKDEGILEAVAYILNTLDSTRSTPFPSLYHTILRQTPSYRRYNKIKKTVIRNLLDKSKAKFESSAKSDKTQIKCAMDFVYNRQLEKAGRINLASDEEMEDELMVFLVGGFESSQHNTSWGIKYLSQSPSAQARLHQELTSVFRGAHADDLPSSKTIAMAHLPYLDACLEEIFRLSRTNAGALRVAVRDTQIYDYFIPKGTDLLAIHSGQSAVINLPPRPAGWASSTKGTAKSESWAAGTLSSFMPERWLTRHENGPWIFNPDAGPSMAFGAGVRGCYGQRLARMTLRILFVTLFLAFEFEPIEGEKASFAAEEKLVRMAKSCYVKLKVRQ